MRYGAPGVSTPNGSSDSLQRAAVCPVCLTAPESRSLSLSHTSWEAPLECAPSFSTSSGPSGASHPNWLALLPWPHHSPASTRPGTACDEVGGHEATTATVAVGGRRNGAAPSIAGDDEARGQASRAGPALGLGLGVRVTAMASTHRHPSHPSPLGTPTPTSQWLCCTKVMQMPYSSYY